MAKILVIEDEMEIRANLMDLLDAEGYEIVGADNGATGIMGALEHKPDLILCDVMMPELDGHDVLYTLRQEPETSLIPFIFLTALADKGDVRKGMNLGADDYLTKPFTRAEVLEAVSTRLDKKDSLQEQYQNTLIPLLQDDLQKFRDSLNEQHVELYDSIRRQYKEGLMKLNIAMAILKSFPPSEERERCLGLIRGVCTAEIKLLTQIPCGESTQEPVLTA